MNTESRYPPLTASRHDALCRKLHAVLHDVADMHATLREAGKDSGVVMMHAIAGIRAHYLCQGLPMDIVDDAVSDITRHF